MTTKERLSTSDLEQRLRQDFSPSPPSPALQEQLAAALRRSDAERQGPRLLHFPGLRVAAAAVVLLLGLSGLIRMLRPPAAPATPAQWADAGQAPPVVQPGPEQAPPTPTPSTQPRSGNTIQGYYTPVLAERVLVDRQDEGVMLIDGHLPVRRMRYRTLDRYEWRNPDTGKRFSMTRPEEQIVYLKLKDN